MSEQFANRPNVVGDASGHCWQPRLPATSPFLHRHPQGLERTSEVVQLMARQAIVRFWTLLACTYLYLDEQHARLVRTDEHVTLGQARQPVLADWPEETQKTHLLTMPAWLQRQFQTGVTPHQVQALLAVRHSAVKVKR